MGIPAHLTGEEHAVDARGASRPSRLMALKLQENIEALEAAERRLKRQRVEVEARQNDAGRTDQQKRADRVEAVRIINRLNSIAASRNAVMQSAERRGLAVKS